MVHPWVAGSQSAQTPQPPRCRPPHAGWGYVASAAALRAATEQGHPSGDGLWLVDTRTGASHLLVSLAQLFAATFTGAFLRFPHCIDVMDAHGVAMQGDEQKGFPSRGRVHVLSCCHVRTCTGILKTSCNFWKVPTSSVLFTPWPPRGERGMSRLPVIWSSACSKTFHRIWSLCHAQVTCQEPRIP